ncbi:hypothetical protein OZK63_40200, partial [Streptomyces sp. UMAF16]|nr:hypothetical protein [Streptomyces sp. UMAF16]
AMDVDETTDPSTSHSAPERVLEDKEKSTESPGTSPASNLSVSFTLAFIAMVALRGLLIDFT